MVKKFLMIKLIRMPLNKKMIQKRLKIKMIKLVKMYNKNKMGKNNNKK